MNLMTRKAVVMALAGTALSAAASSAMASTTMYNTFTTTAASQTDGWTRIYDDPLDTTSVGVATGPESDGNKGDIVPWYGTNGGTTSSTNLPFGYTGSSHLNWAVSLSGVGDTAQISAADSQARYGFAAEIDTGGGAWNDNGTNAQGLPTTNGPTGWKHQTDIGLIQSDVDQFITLNPVTLGAQSPTFSRFGVTVFDGMDTKTGDYVHHGAWNCPACAPTPTPFTNSNPFGTIGLTNIGYSDNIDGTTGFKFLAQAGHTYSIYLGGVGFSRWNAGVDNYQLNISTSAVPVPAAVWLLGSALAGMGIIGRRRDKVSA